MPHESTPSTKALDLVEILACPKCKGTLSLREATPAFVCQTCHLAYAIVDDIPNFIIEEATPT